MRYIKKIADFLLFSNIYLGICISVLALPFTQGAPEYFVFHAFVFFATVGVYSILRVRSIRFVPIDAQAYLKWAKNNTTVAQGVKYSAVAITVILFFFLSRGMETSILSLGFLWVLYNLPIFSGHRIKFGLRYVWFLKPFIVGLIIAGLCALVPLVERWVDIMTIVYATFDIFCFASALVVLFEVKDMKVDAPFNTFTIPLKIGVTGTKVIAITLLVISIGATFLFFHDDSLFLGSVKGSPFLLMILYLTFFFDENTDEYTYWGLIDGWMLYMGLFWYFLI